MAVTSAALAQDRLFAWAKLALEKHRRVAQAVARKEFGMICPTLSGPVAPRGDLIEDRKPDEKSFRSPKAMQLQLAELCFLPVTNCERQMRGRTLAILILGVVASTPAWAGFGPRVPGSNTLASPLSYPGAPKPPAPEREKAPYAMNYTDEAAQTLGVRDGHMDLFTTRPASRDGLMPTISGGLGGEGAMLRLQWRPGF